MYTGCTHTHLLVHHDRMSYWNKLEQQSDIQSARYVTFGSNLVNYWADLPRMNLKDDIISITGAGRLNNKTKRYY